MALAVAALAVTGASSAQAMQISRNNPYRSFSISGINYASVQWEKQHRKSGGTQYRKAPSNRLFYRR